MKKLNLDEIHSALLDMLVEFDRICRKYNLKYSLAAGTLLGAARHKGFIPWDDDVDVYMTRPEYEKFIKIVSEGNVLSEHFSITKDRGRGTYCPFIKLLDDRYILKSPNHEEVPHLFLDIFPVDPIPTDRKEWEKIHKKEKYWNITAGICQWYTMDRWWGFIAYIIGWWFYLGTKLFIGAKRSVRKLNEYAQKIPYEQGEMVMAHFLGSLDEAMPVEAYENLQEMEFEGKKFLAIADWKEFLTKKYGKNCYVELPPENKRRSRHYIRVYVDDKKAK